MEQGRLKHLIILSPYKSHFDKIDLIEKALHLLKKMTAGSVHLEDSIFRFFFTLHWLDLCEKSIFHNFFLRNWVQFLIFT